MIEIRDLRFRCLNIPLLCIEPGITAIIGPNGAGKSSLLELISGITLPEQGSILIGGIKPRVCTIGWVSEFPDRNMLFSRVRDEIASPLMFNRITGEIIERELDRTAEQMHITDLISRSPRNISGGEKILVALASALITRPNVIILDETDSHLDGDTISRMDGIIREAGIGFVLFSTHRKDHAISADRVLRIEKGMIGGYGTPEKILHDLPYPYLLPLRGKCS